ncbi:GMC family oxidoreductase N-terminal domain-containing protein [Variovorax humicola]|uniref:GMC family oxidoreductase N-terminal domain-containing protein n=1 Tax=Variovorax humicola TaxID=1769758 RepID=A0ABU8WAH1_9BURK
MSATREEIVADYVIVGAGTAGCVLANRLSANGKYKVMLIEAGGPDRHPMIHIPAGFLRLLDHPSITWNYKTAPEAQASDREILFPRGRGLGGSSSINGLLYVRPFAADIDAWEAGGAVGWNFANCLPYYSRSETWQDGSDPRRGSDGPIQVTRVSSPPAVCAEVIKAGQELGLDMIDDPNATTRGPSIWYYQQTRHGRVRSSAARGYLWPAASRPNLSVHTDLHVTRVTMEGEGASRTVTGVECQSATGDVVAVKARREVILSAGVIGTPRLLEMSGIGDPGVLDNAGIRTQVALPGVGNNLQDHYVTRLCFRIKGIATANERSHGAALAREVAKYVVAGGGILTYSAAVIGAFASSGLVDRPDVQFVIAPGSFKEGRIGELENEPGLSFGVWQMRPESRGHVHVVSSDRSQAPAIAPLYLSSELDRQTTIAGLRIGRALAKQPSLAPYVVGETVPGPQADSDDALLQYARDNGSTVYHGVGTCRMGADPAEGAVVDAELRVYGIQRLRVIDGSIMPTMTSTNTNATVLMIAERAADMLLSEAQHALGDGAREGARHPA